jgi:adenylate cyclase
VSSPRKLRKAILGPDKAATHTLSVSVFAVLLLAPFTSLFAAPNIATLTPPADDAWVALQPEDVRLLRLPPQAPRPAPEDFRGPGVEALAQGFDYGFSRDVFWLRLDLQAIPEDNTPRTLFLEIRNSSLSHAEMRVLRKTSGDSNRAADHVEKQNFTGGRFSDGGPFPHRYIAFPVEVSSQESVVILRIASVETVSFPLRLYGSRAFREVVQQERFFLGFYYGLLALMFFYNAVLLLAVQERSYVYYLLYLGTSTVAQFVLDGLAFEFLTSSPVALLLTKVFSSLSMFAAVQFSRSFLNLSAYAPRLDRIANYVALLYPVLGLASALLPASTSAPWVNRLVLTGALFVLGIAVHAVLRGPRSARFLLVGWAVFVLSVAGTAARNLGFLDTGNFGNYLLHYGSALEIAILSFGLRVRILTLRREKEASERAALEQRVQLLESYARFVPEEFSQKLSRPSMAEVQAGDGAALDMSVLFADMRGFTARSERMAAEDNFRFINAFLERMEPAIHGNGGFIDKFIGDAIMALFDRPEDALAAARDMQANLRAWNAERARAAAASEAVRIGIGVHHGPVLLGAVGGASRLNTTVIGDTVNLAARLESLCKRYESECVGVIASDALVKRLPKEAARGFALRKLGRVRVKGRGQALTIFELPTDSVSIPHDS